MFQLKHFHLLQSRFWQYTGSRRVTCSDFHELREDISTCCTEAVILPSTKIATGVTKTAIQVAPAVLTNGGKDVHFQGLTPKELKKCYRQTRSLLDSLQ